ncbi:MAG TPA: class II aldolase/adducin family protein [Ktedonobacterales bacterium]|jgi:L-fuculose-phosphate aldolase
MESTDMTYDDLRTQMIAAVRLLFDTGVMSHSGHANMSIRLPEPERLLMTARGQVGDLTAEQLAVVTLAGEVIEGEVDSTNREIIAMHAVVYQERPEAQAVIHTHSPHVTSFALAHQPLPCRYEALLRFGVVEDIPVAAWGPRGSEESIRAIRETLQAHPGVPAVLLANHGLLAFGTAIGATAQLIVAMEEAAGMTLGAVPLGGAQPFPEGALEQVRAHIARFA